MPGESRQTSRLDRAQGSARRRRLTFHPNFSKSAMNQHMPPEPVPLFDIGAQRRRLGKSIDEALGRVLAHCQFVSGPEVTELERALAEFCGAKHVVTCASGTDA